MHGNESTGRPGDAGSNGSRSTPLPDQHALAMLLEHPEWISDLARRLVDPDQVDDVTQETWVAALRSPPRNPLRIRGWLYTVVLNCKRLVIRDRERRRQREHRVARSEAVPDLEMALELEELRCEVVRTVHELREPYRSTIVRRYFEGLSVREIAELDGVPTNTVHVRLSRAHELLKERLNKHTEKRHRAGLLLLLAFPRTGDYPAPVLLRRTMAAVAATMIVGLGLWYFWPEQSSARPAVAARGDPEVERVATTMQFPGSESPGRTAEHVDGSASQVRTLPAPAAAPALHRMLVVAADTGEPVVSAEVFLGAATMESRALARGRTALDVVFRDLARDPAGTTDASGVLDIPRDRLAMDMLGVRAPGYLEYREPLTARRLDGPYRVVLDPAPRAQVQVLRPDGSAASGFDATVVGSGGTREAASTDVTGRFPFTWQDHAYAIEIEARGFAPVRALAELPLTHIQLRTATPRPASEPPSEPRSEPATEATGTDAAVTATYVGRVFGPDGRALSGGLVRILPRSGAFRSRNVVEAAVDAAGEFQVGPAATGDPVLLIEHPEHADQIVDPASREWRDRDYLSVQLSAGRELHGITVDPVGTPVPHVSLTVGWVCGDEIRGVRVQSDDDGRFVARGLPPAPFRHRPGSNNLRWRGLVDAEAPGHLIEVLRPHELVSSNGETVPTHGVLGSRNTCCITRSTDPVELVVTASARPPTLFELVTPDGAAVRTLSNLAIFPDANPTTGRNLLFGGLTGNPGNLHVPSALEGSTILHLTRHYAATITRVDPGAAPEPQRLVLTPRQTIHLQLDDARGNGVAQRALFVIPVLAGQPLPVALNIGRTRDDGGVTIDQLPDGEYMVGVAHDEGAVRVSRPLCEALPASAVRNLVTIHVQGARKDPFQITIGGEDTKP